MTNDMTVAEYLLSRLRELTVDHVFGIPGDFILPFFETMSSHPVQHVACCNELNAGYAADGYARIRGMGAVAVTYGPGAFSLVNAIAGCYAESVPVVVISGGPKRRDYVEQPKLHHILPHSYEASLRIFEQLTGFSAVVTSADQAPAIIDQALLYCWQNKKPVYLEIPSDLQTCTCTSPRGPLALVPKKSKEATLGRVIDSIMETVESGKRTVILPGHEIHRYGLEENLIRLSEASQLAVASLFIGKADYMESHAQCIGLYQGKATPEVVREYVEGADTLLFLGAIESDFNLGGFTADLSGCNVIWARDTEVIIGSKTYEEIQLADLVAALTERLNGVGGTISGLPRAYFYPSESPLKKPTDAPMTDRYFYDRISHFLQADDIIAGDGGGFINGAHIETPPGGTIVCSGYWASIGAGFGMAVGCCFAAREDQRVIALEGDGSFQMTAQELSTMTRYGKSAIVFVINNHGYCAERVIHDGEFNDIADWKYHQLSEPFGGTGIEVTTERQFEQALEVAANYKEPAPLLIEIQLNPNDFSHIFKTLGASLKQQQDITDE